MIKDTVVRQLKQYTDERGYFSEIVRKSDPVYELFGQWSESLMYSGTIKAWHIHQKQVDYWRVPVGVVQAVLCDMREDSPTYLKIDEYLMGDGHVPFLLKIPQGVAHGCKVLQGPALLIYLTTREYDPDDEGRIPFDDERIGYDWLKREIK